MLREIQEQPPLLSSNAQPLLSQAQRAVKKARPSLILLVARGSSDNACLYARYLFEIHLRIPSLLAAPSVLTRYGAKVEYPKSLVIGVSQSAAAPDVSEVLENARKNGHKTLSITNVERGPVTEAARSHIFLGAGEERAVAATKTYTLTLLAFYQIARAMGASLPEPEVAPAVARAADSPGIRDAVETLTRARLLFSLGRGYQFSTAHEAALKLMECALLPCKAYSTADFAHGPVALAGPDAAALCFGVSARDKTIPRLKASRASIISAPRSNLADTLQPFPSVVFAQRLAYEAALEKSLDPDTPRNLTKITRTR